MVMYEGTPNAWDTDSVEFFIDYSNKAARTRDQYRIDLKGIATYYDTQGYTGDETRKFGFENWAASKIDGGYSVEFEVRAYNEPIAADMDIGVHFLINDMTSDGNHFCLHSDKCLNDPANFGFVTLSSETVTAVAEPDAPVSAATGDPATALAVVSALSVCAAAVTRNSKKH